MLSKSSGKKITKSQEYLPMFLSPDLPYLVSGALCNWVPIPCQLTTTYIPLNLGAYYLALFVSNYPKLGEKCLIHYYLSLFYFIYHLLYWGHANYRSIDCIYQGSHTHVAITAHSHIQYTLYVKALCGIHSSLLQSVPMHHLNRMMYHA